MNKSTHLKVISRQGVSREEGGVATASRPAAIEKKIPPSLRIGEIVGRHRIVKRIGRGSIGDVYLCEDVELPDLRVALKVLAPHRIITPELKKRFKNEIAASARVNHRNVIRPYEFIQKRDFLAYTMEYVRGGDLAGWMTKHKEFNVKNALNILLQICTGVQAIHDAGIIHRDLKPQNILVSDKEDVRISDFAVSRTSDFERVTLRGRLVGTIDYLSPQYLEHGTVTSSCDIYAIGAIAFEMLTHRAPLTGNGLYETLALKLTREAPDVHELNPDCPVFLSAIISKALRRDPHERYGSAKEMATDIARMLQDFDTASTVKVQSITAILEQPRSLDALGDDILGRSLSELYPLVPVEVAVAQGKAVAATADVGGRRSLSVIGFLGGFSAAVCVALVVAIQHTPFGTNRTADVASPTTSSKVSVISPEKTLDDSDEADFDVSSRMMEVSFPPRIALFSAALVVEAVSIPEPTSSAPSIGEATTTIFVPYVEEVRVVRKPSPRKRRVERRPSPAERQRIEELKNTVSASLGMQNSKSGVGPENHIGTTSPTNAASMVTHGSVVSPAAPAKLSYVSESKSISKKRSPVSSRRR